MIELHIETDNPTLRLTLQDGYNRVAPYFDFPANVRLLCFLDDENDPAFMANLGVTNRGFHISVKDYFAASFDQRPILPRNPQKHLALDAQGKTNYDNLVYLQGSTTRNFQGYIMSLAHELQHAWQNVKHRDSLQTCMQMQHERASLHGEYRNLPHEQEAMVVSRKIAVQICGRERIDSYIKNQLDATRQEVIRWNYLNDWNTSFSDLRNETETARSEHRLAFPNSSL
jgi:hypothetical protein